MPIRDPSPRRYTSSTAHMDRAPSPLLRQKTRYDRLNSPIQGRASALGDTYTPTDSVPQRRVRENDIDYDIDVKRRRVERSPSPRVRDITDDRSMRADRPTSSLPPDSSEMSRTWLVVRQPIAASPTYQLHVILKDLGNDSHYRLKAIASAQHPRSQHQSHSLLLKVSVSILAATSLEQKVIATRLHVAS